ncbi:MAG: hypothetical protein ACXAEL_13660, partial [Candidatus Hodarchaeales archaeon]
RFKDVTSIDYLLDCAKSLEEPSYFFQIIVYEHGIVVAQYEREFSSYPDSTHYARFVAKFLRDPEYRRQFQRQGEWNGIIEFKAPSGHRINPVCQKGIRRLNSKRPGQLRFKNFMNLKTGGRDAFSRLKHTQLEALIPSSALKMIFQEEMDESMTLSCLRWVARGLKPQLAIRKVKIDREVQENAQRSRHYQ